MIKLSIVFSTINQFEILMQSVKFATENLEHPEETELFIIDNGSDVEIPTHLLPESIETLGSVRIVRNEANSGAYPVFKQGLATQGDIIAFLHSDVFVYQKGWDTQVRAQFEGQPQLGLMGFIGSTELDNWGGRGMGTISNMQGRTVDIHAQDGRHIIWKGSSALVHGKQSSGMTIDGSVVDGCVMIFRRSVLDGIPFREEYAPHHFEDRLMSCQVIEAGHKVGILGIEFDHVSGQVANHEGKWQLTSAAWFKLKLGIDTPQEWATMYEDWVKRGNSPSRGKIPDQFDYCAYLCNERLFLTEYRDQKHMVPMVYGKRV